MIPRIWVFMGIVSPPYLVGDTIGEGVASITFNIFDVVMLAAVTDKIKIDFV
jgi:hypothetical protein